MNSPRIPRRLSALTTAAAAVLALAAIVLDPVVALAADPPAQVGAAEIVVETSTGQVLLDRQSADRREPASVTKVMTAIVVLENADLDATVTVEEGDFAHLTPDSSIAGFKVGETLTVEQLLYGLRLPSGNEAAYILARATAGSVDDFVALMNERAAELGCTDTHFANPCGLHADDHYTSARDLALIARQALSMDQLMEICSTPVYQMPATNMQDARELENSNLLVVPDSEYFLEGATGVKTGFTDEAGRCLMATAERDGVSLACVVLGCPDDSKETAIADARGLLAWGLDGFQWGLATEAGDALGGEPLQLAAVDDLEALIDVDAAEGDIEAVCQVDPNLAAPVMQGAEVGSAELVLDGMSLGTVQLVAADTVLPDPLALGERLVRFLAEDRGAQLAIAGAGGVLVVTGAVAAVIGAVRSRRH